MSLLKPDLAIIKFDSKNWLLKSEQKNILINASTLNLVGILQNSQSLEEACNSFQAYHKIDLSREEFLNLVESQFKGKGILMDDDNITPSVNYLNFKFNFISASKARFFAKSLKFLYSPKSFGFIGFLILCYIFVFFSNYKNFLSLNYSFKNSELGVVFFITFLSLLIHELGHTAALNKNGIEENGNIGFGFYTIFPVLYSDVSKAWQLSRYQRIIINLGGIISEIVFTIFLCALYLLTHKDFLIVSAFTIIVHALFQLNPFRRSDGYWILSDGLNIPNLLPKSKKMIASILEFKTIKLGVNSKKLLFILCYGFVNYLFLISFIYYSLANHFEGLIRFPITILNTFWKLMSFNFAAIEIKTIWILYIGFYRMVYVYGQIILKFITSKFELNNVSNLLFQDKIST